VRRGLAIALALAPILVLAKAAALLRAGAWEGEAPGKALRMLCAVAHEDVVFAALCGVAAALALLAARGRPRLERAVYIGLLALGGLAATFAVAHIEIFRNLRSPLTVPLARMAADPRIASSLSAYFTPPVTAGLIGAPLIFLALAIALERRSRERTTGALAAACAGAIAFVAVGVPAERELWQPRLDSRMSKSPHEVLLRSLASEALRGGSSLRAGAFREEDLADFAPILTGDAPLAATRAAVASTLAAEAPRPRNVVLVVLESVGARHLSLYGSPFDATPRLTAAAWAHGLVAEEAYAHVGWSSAALIPLLLGRLPLVTWRHLPETYPTIPGTPLAELLSRSGHRTACFAASEPSWGGMGALVRARGGFDEVRAFEELGCAPHTSWGVADRCAFDAAIGLMGRSADEGRPFFAMIWTDQTHHPYEPLPDAPIRDFFAGREAPVDAYDLGRYLNALAETDRQIGRLLDALAARGLSEDTLVVVTGDHGEAFGETPGVYGHGGTVLEAQVRVPFVLVNPRLFPRGERRAGATSQVDVLPTIADALGLAPAPEWQGRSIFAGDHAGRAYMYALRYDALLGVREGRWKYVLDATNGGARLHDLATDPGETRDVAAENAAVAARLHERIAAWIEADRRSRAEAEGAVGAR